MRNYQANIITKSPATPTGPSATGSAPGIWRMDEVAYWVKQGVWPNASIINDPNFRNVSLLLSTTALGNANNNLFVDSSGAFNPISRVNNTTQGSVTPYSASWSNFFDGSGDYFTVPYTTANFDWYTAGVDFTIEYWFFANSLTGTSYTDGATTVSTVVGNRSATAGTNYWSFGPVLSGAVIFYYFNGGPVSVTSTATVTANSWNHVAMTKTSSGITIFVNGVAQTTTAISGTPQSSASFPITVGQGNNTSYNGYVSNLRIVRGTAIYSGNFTVPTAPLTAVTNTKLLTCQSNRFRDASTNNLTLTVTGNTSVTEFSPFAPAYPGISYNQSDITNWSGYFDGSGDYLYYGANSAFAFGTGNFTVEFFVYTTSTASQMVYDTIQPGTSGGGSTRFYVYINTSQQLVVGPFPSQLTTTGTISLGAWNHVAIVRSGTTRTVYINGVSAASDTFSGDLTSGYATVGFDAASGGTIILNGYLSNLRAVKGTAVYTSAFTPPTTNLTAISGTSLLICQNAAFTDNSTNNFVVTINGNTTVTGNSPFNTVGYWSLAGATNQGATIPQTTATDLGAGNFTVECWVNVQSFGSFVTKRRTDTALTGSWQLTADASGFFYFLGVGWASTYAATTNPIPLNTWTHVAVSRSGTNLSMFVNGTRVYNVTDSYDYTCSTYTIIKLGGNSGGNYPSGSTLSFGFNGSISNLRIVQGTAVYNPASTTLTVPTSPLTAISGTSLLTCQNGTMKDNSANNNTSILLYNGGSIQSFDPFYTSTPASNGGSMYFDGSDDYLTTNAQTALSYGTGDFTLEAWVNPTSINADFAGVLDARAGATATNYLFGLRVSGGVYKVELYIGAQYTGTTTVGINTWTHIAVSRSSGTLRIFVNGVLDTSWSGVTTSVNANAASQLIGAIRDGAGYYFPGYITDLRAVNGTAVYTAAFTPPTTPVTPTPNTVLLLNGMNAGAYDATAINNMETVGNAQVSTAVSKFGGSSVYFDGSGDYLTSNASSDLYAFGTGDFTIEMWFNLSSFASLQVLYDSRPTSTDGLYPCIYVAAGGTAVNLQVSAAAQITGTTTLSTGTWYHLALSRSSGSTKMFLNGTQIGSTYADTNAYLNSGTTRPFIGGSSYSAGTLTVNGYIDDLRVTKGVARYTTTFTPPTQAFPVY